jgi:uncharacterized RDD family membrane protein YckC
MTKIKSNVSLIRRLGAIIYDIFLVFSLVFFIAGILVAIFNDKLQNNSILFIIVCAVIYFYFAISWIKGRQTLGMKAWKFQVVQNNGQNITQKQAFIRFLLAIFSFSAFGLGFIYQIFNKNIALHDKYSNTILIKN